MDVYKEKKWQEYAYYYIRIHYAYTIRILFKKYENMQTWGKKNQCFFTLTLTFRACLLLQHSHWGTSKFWHPQIFNKATCSFWWWTYPMAHRKQAKSESPLKSHQVVWRSNRTEVQVTQLPVRLKVSLFREIKFRFKGRKFVRDLFETDPVLSEACAAVGNKTSKVKHCNNCGNTVSGCVLKL